MNHRQALLYLIHQMATEPHAIRFIRNQFKMDRNRAEILIQQNGIQFPKMYSRVIKFTPKV